MYNVVFVDFASNILQKSMVKIAHMVEKKKWTNKVIAIYRGRKTWICED